MSYLSSISPTRPVVVSTSRSRCPAVRVRATYSDFKETHRTDRGRKQTPSILASFISLGPLGSFLPGRSDPPSRPKTSSPEQLLSEAEDPWFKAFGHLLEADDGEWDHKGTIARHSHIAARLAEEGR